MRSLPSLRIVRGYWTANPTVGGKRRTWTFGKIEEKSEEKALDELRAKLSNSPQPQSTSALTLVRLVEGFLADAKKTYVDRRGVETGEAANLAYGLRPLVALVGAIAAEDFRPRHVDTFIKSQIKQGVSRQTINKRIGYIKRMLRWGKEKELITPTPFEYCRDLSGLRAGRGARESAPIEAVPLNIVELTLTHLPEVLQDMVRLQLLAAMRPEEVCAMRLRDVDMSGKVWVYVPRQHKNEWRGKQRRIYLGPKAQAIVGKYVGMELDAPIFSPRLAIKQRRSKLPRSHRYGDSYDTRSYRKAIWYACDLAEIDRWSPNRLRKAQLDLVERDQGKQAARAYAGHTRVETTQDHYLSRDDSLARKVAEKVG